MCAYECLVFLATTLNMEQLAVFEHTSAEVRTDAADIVDDSAGCSLPAVARHKGVAVGGALGVPQRRNLFLEVFALNHVGIAPSARGIERLVSRLVVHKVHIACGLVVDVVHLLDGLEYLVVVGGNVGNVGIGECRTAAADVTPGGSATVVNQHRFLASFGKIAEQAATSYTTTGYEHLYLFALHVVGLREHIHLFGFLVIDVTEGHLASQRRARCGVANHFDAMGAQYLTGSRYAALSAAGAHPKTCDMLDFIDRDILTVADGSQQVFY